MLCSASIVFYVIALLMSYYSFTLEIDSKLSLINYDNTALIQHVNEEFLDCIVPFIEKIENTRKIYNDFIKTGQTPECDLINTIVKLNSNLEFIKNKYKNSSVIQNIKFIGN